jgi:hypothetical protein
MHCNANEMNDNDSLRQSTVDPGPVRTIATAIAVMPDGRPLRHVAGVCIRAIRNGVEQTKPGSVPAVHS